MGKGEPRGNAGGEPRRRRNPDLGSELAELRRVVGRLTDVDARALVGRKLAPAIETLERDIRALEALRNRLALRAEETNVHKRDDAGGSYRTSADWLAAKTGTTTSAAREKLDTAKRLEGLPEVDEAVRNGDLSEKQTTVVARAGDAAPERQGELVETAKHSSIKKLNDECRSVIADTHSAADEAERLENQRRKAHLHTRNDIDGMFCGSFAFAPDDRSARIKTRLEAETDRLIRTSKRANGTKRSYDWYAAQALANIITGQTDTTTAGGNDDTQTADTGAVAGGVGSNTDSRPDKTRNRREVCIDIDLQALQRGYRTSGERCEIAGLGPVPVEMATDLADSPFIKAVIRDGTDIHTVVHWGRRIPNEVRTALQTRDPTCSVPGCDHTFGLEYDHNQPYAQGGPTNLDNLQPLCKYHHNLKTHHGYKLKGEPGRRRWHHPNGHTITQDPDPPPPDSQPRSPADPEAGAGAEGTLFS